MKAPGGLTLIQPWQSARFAAKSKWGESNRVVSCTASRMCARNANAYLIEGAACFNRKFVINPKPGNLLVFPSYLTHWVQPNGDSTDRVTVAFNIRYLKQSDPVRS